MEELIKELMGESYHEGLTGDEIQTFFKNNVLNSGDYVRKEMADAEKKKLLAQIKEKENALKSKLTDDEKKSADEQARLQEIEDLKKQLLENKVSSNSYKALGLTAEARINANIKDDDTDFAKFIENIVSEDETKTKEISSYVNKIVKAAYEKGKADMTKDKMAKMGNFKNTGNNDDGNKGLGARLAKSRVSAVKKNNYFQN